MNSSAADPASLDVRALPAGEKHARIFQRWTDLPVGAHFVLINNHDPLPLFHQFAARFPGAFGWEHTVSGTGAFHVKITRLAVPSVDWPPLPPSQSGPAEPAGEEIDVRGLEPPEPLMRILAAVATLAPGVTLHARTDRRPLHLYTELTARGMQYFSQELPDGSWRTTFRHR